MAELPLKEGGSLRSCGERSLTRFFEEAVEERLARLEERPVRRIELPVSSVSGPTMNTGELKRRIETVQQEDDLAALK